MTTTKKPSTKKRSKPTPPKRGKKRGPPSTREVLGRVLDGGLTEQMQATGKAVFARIERLAKANKDIPISLLGAARLCAEWHTDYLTVHAAMPDIAADAGPKESE